MNNSAIINLKIEKQEGVEEFILSSPELTDLTVKGFSPPEVLREFADRLEQVSMAASQMSYQDYIRANRTTAFSLFYNLHYIMGNDWFELRHLMSKVKEPKQDVILKLQFLEQYGYVQKDKEGTIGVRYCLVADEETRVKVSRKRIEELQGIIQQLEVAIEDIEKKPEPKQEQAI